MVPFLIISLLFRDIIVTYKDIKFLLNSNTIDIIAILICIRIITTLVIIIFAIYALKLFGKYSKNAPRVLKEYRWFYVGYNVIVEVIALIVYAFQNNTI